MSGRSRLWMGAESNVHFAFAGVALLLLLLNLLTPSLLGGGISYGGTFLSAGSLLVGMQGNDNLTFALESQGKVQFQRVSVGLNLSGDLLGSEFPGNATTAWNWTQWINSSMALASVFVVSNLSHPGRSAFLVNVSALSTSSGSSPTTLSEGTFAFLFTGYGPTVDVTVYPLWPLHGAITLPSSSISHWKATDLPQTLLLGQGTPPSSGAGP